MGLPMAFGDILGHERPLRVLRRTLASGRIPHAYLFWGPDGIGKERVAREVARCLLCADRGAVERAEACGTCGACRRVAAGDHPDLHVRAPAGSSISVAEVRSLQETLSYRAFERGRKVAIIRDAYRLTREAANALLKTLEEPPAGTHIVLLAHHRNQLLPTLVSRCQALRFDPIAVDAVKRLLVDRGVAPSAAQTMAEISGGCPGLVWDEDPEAFAAVEEEVRELAVNWDGLTATDRFAAASRWASEKDRLGARLDGLERVLRQRLREAAARDGECAAEVAAMECLVRARRWLDQNVNTQLALDGLFLGLGGRDEEDTP